MILFKEVKMLELEPIDDNCTPVEKDGAIVFPCE